MQEMGISLRDLQRGRPRTKPSFTLAALHAFSDFWVIHAMRPSNFRNIGEALFQIFDIFAMFLCMSQSVMEVLVDATSSAIRSARARPNAHKKSLDGAPVLRKLVALELHSVVWGIARRVFAVEFPFACVALEIFDLRPVESHRRLVRRRWTRKRVAYIC